MAISLYDSYQKKLFSFSLETTTEQGVLKMYSCGPTVYGYQSIGNMRAVWLPDTVARIAHSVGFVVKWTLNITDVGHLVGDGDTGEDKIEKAAKKNNTTVQNIIEKYTEDYYRQCHALRFAIPTGTMQPKATEYIQEQMLLALQLIKRGFAYLSEDGIYFDYQTFVAKHTHSHPELLAILERDARSHGDRSHTERTIVSNSKHPYDFAVWKFVDPKSLQQWTFEQFSHAYTLCNTLNIDKTYLTKPGCPGWHSECVCMILGTLGDTTDINTSYPQPSVNNPVIDIHFGGEDHIDIHHKNEILQSEACDIYLSRNWVHNKFVLVDGKKMSKSLNNIYLVTGEKSVTGYDSIEEKGYDPLAYRLMLFEHHYTEQLNFTWEKLQSSQNRLYNMRKQIAMIRFSQNILQPAITTVSEEHISFLTQNLNTPLLLEKVNKDISLIVYTIEKGVLTDTTAVQDLAALDASILDLDLFPDIPQEILNKAEVRLQAKQKKDFTMADILRQELLASRWQVDDYKFGFALWKR